MIAWPKARLDECTRIVSGATPSTSVDAYWNGSICWVTPKDLSDLDGPYLDDTPRKITEAGLQNCAAEVLPVGSVLFSSRAPIGHVSVNRVPVATNQGFKSFVPDVTKLDAKFLFHWLRKNRPYLESLGNGATFKEVSKAVVSRVEIPLPPLAEQRRIAAILDQGEALRAKRRYALAQLDTLTQSFFLDLFGDPRANLHDWRSLRIAELCDFQNGYAFRSEDYRTSGIPIIRMSNITRTGELDIGPSRLKYFPQENVETVSKFLLKKNDVVIAMTDMSKDMGIIGRTAIVDRSNSYLLNQRVGRFTIRDSSRLHFAYLHAYTNQPHFIDYIKAACAGGLQLNASTQSIVSHRILLPPIELQEQYAAQASAVARLKVAQRAALAKMDSLFASLQYRAFRGEL